jgi:hypothetical protein
MRWTSKGEHIAQPLPVWPLHTAPKEESASNTSALSSSEVSSLDDDKNDKSAIKEGIDSYPSNSNVFLRSPTMASKITEAEEPGDEGRELH